MIFLDVDDLLHIAERNLGGPPMVHDLGLLEAACARPQASYGGEPLYPALELKAAALMQSIAKKHALVDGNKRLAITAVVAFLGLNGRRLSMGEDEFFDFAIAVATGELDDVAQIAAVIEQSSAPRP